MSLNTSSLGSLFRWSVSTADAAVQAANATPQVAGLPSSAADRLQEDVQHLRQDVERLLMITEALWSLVQEQHGYPDEELFRRIAEIDLSDGRADGRVAPAPPARCPVCGKNVSRRRGFCLYCGKPLVTDPFAR